MVGYSVGRLYSKIFISFPQNWLKINQKSFLLAESHFHNWLKPKGFFAIKSLVLMKKKGIRTNLLLHVRLVTFYSRQEEDHCLTLSGSLILLPWLDQKVQKESKKREIGIEVVGGGVVRLLSFCFHLITDVKGLYSAAPLFALCLTSLYYSFIYFNYPGDVNLSLPLISFIPPLLQTINVSTSFF